MLSGIIDKQNIEVLKDLFSKESFFETCATLGSPVVIITDENVEKLYGKKVEAVRIVKVPSKERNLGKRTMTKRKSYKKAIVRFVGKAKIEINNTK